MGAYYVGTGEARSYGTGPASERGACTWIGTCLESECTTDTGREERDCACGGSTSSAEEPFSSIVMTGSFFASFRFYHDSAYGRWFSSSFTHQWCSSSTTTSLHHSNISVSYILLLNVYDLNCCSFMVCLQCLESQHVIRISSRVMTDSE